MDVRGYADFVPLGASVVPMRSSDNIMWTVKFRSGQIKRFKFPIRTTPEGSAVPNGGWTDEPDLASPALYTEPTSLKLDKVWTK
jgi:adenylylsulfate reductase subunit B